MQTPVVNAQQAGLAAASADMNAYAQACLFLLAPPMVVAYAHASAQSLTGSAVTAITWAQPQKDNDVTWTSGLPDRFTVNTPGFYEFAARVFVGQAATTAESFVQVTTGTGNPNGSGIVTSYWHASMLTFTGNAMAVGSQGIIPVPLYAGDVLQFMVQPQNTCTTANGVGSYWGDWSHRLVSL